MADAPSTAPIQAPRGTRDFYPEDFLRRKFVFDRWRGAALRHGFDEIDGPTFEHLDLYTRKSGEGIVSELFSFRRSGGETDFALRPEFTPTLARMVAAKANALPKPIKWFSIANFFRAERPQRGRLREFTQWNCDILGDPSPEADAECIACCVEALRGFGLRPSDVKIRISHRGLIARFLRASGVYEHDVELALALLDRRQKMEATEFEAAARKLRLDPVRFQEKADAFQLADREALERDEAHEYVEVNRLLWSLRDHGVAEWCTVDFSIVRGLAYYTGAVFEVHEASGAERAIAGGGRYDNLVELFGGPPTPAVGFAMGDVVLSLVLEDKGLIPKGADLRRAVGAAPDVFVISSGADGADERLQPVLAALRREGLHARRSYKATKNVGKLLKEAAEAGAGFAAILEAGGVCTLKDLGTGEQEKDVPEPELAARIRAGRAR